MFFRKTIEIQSTLFAAQKASWIKKDLVIGSKIESRVLDNYLIIESKLRTLCLLVKKNGGLQLQIFLIGDRIIGLDKQ